MIVTDKVIIAHDGDRSIIVTSEVIQCGCGRMAAILIQKHGKTMCVQCEPTPPSN